MEIGLDELLNGNATIIKNKEYLSAKEYIAPFIDAMSPYTDQFNIKVKLADQLSVQEKTNIIYNRVLIEAVLPEEHCIENHDEVIGFLYGLDIRKPIAKTYRGYLNRACTNLSVFSPMWITYQEMQPVTKLDYNIAHLLEQPSQFRKQIEGMKTVFLPREKKEDFLGECVDFSLRKFNHNGIHSTKLSSANVIDAYTDVYIDAKSPYYVNDQEESSLFNMYNALTQVLTDDKKDIMNTFEKTLLIGQMLKLV